MGVRNLQHARRHFLSLFSTILQKRKDYKRRATEMKFGKVAKSITEVPVSYFYIAHAQSLPSLCICS